VAPLVSGVAKPEAKASGFFDGSDCAVLKL